MDYRNYRNRKGQTGLPYHTGPVLHKTIEKTEHNEPTVTGKLSRYMCLQTIAATVILVVITVIRLVSDSLYQSVETGMRENSIASLSFAGVTQEVMGYIQESETISELFPRNESAGGQGNGTVWNSEFLSGALTECANSQTSFACPIAYTQISSGYGERIDPFTGEGAFHRGIDLAAPEGSSVVAAADGVVLACKYDEIGGWYVIVDHGRERKSYYGHLSQIKVSVGDTVLMGQEIALSGNTGKTTGPHLHFELAQDGQSLDPTPYIHV